MSGVSIVPSPNLFPKSLTQAFPARYAPLCEAQSFPKWKVRENAIQSGRDFAKAIFWGKDFAKISADSF